MWNKFSKIKPPRFDKYLIFAPCGTHPLKGCIWFDPEKDEWLGIVKVWAGAITHWMEFPEDPQD